MRSNTDKQQRFDVAILNWDRPSHIEGYLIPLLLDNPNVDRVYISNGKTETLITSQWERVESIDHTLLNAAHGLARRYDTAELSDKRVMIIDDDMIITHDNINTLCAASNAHPDRIVGFFPRYIFATHLGSQVGRFSVLYKHFLDPIFWKNWLIAAPTPYMVITKMLIAPQAAFAAFHKHEGRVDAFVRNNSAPLWNGEDIFLNMAYFFETGKLPVAVKLGEKIRETAASKTGISTTCKDHFYYRNRFIKEIMREFGYRQSGHCIKKIN